VDFEWDEAKAASNLVKHRVSFDEAVTVFDNNLAATFDDPEHSATERRQKIVGHSIMNRLLVVWFTERSRSIRIISARPADKKERHDYEENVLRS
jgi:uncharacterized DUF497 family protein